MTSIMDTLTEIGMTIAIQCGEKPCRRAVRVPLAPVFFVADFLVVPHVITVINIGRVLGVTGF